MRRDEVLATLEAQASDLKARFGLESLYVFGSTARDEATEASDVDLLVVFQPDAGAGFFALSRLKSHLEQVLGCSVDLLTPGAIRPRMRGSIEKDLIHAA